MTTTVDIDRQVTALTLSRDYQPIKGLWHEVPPGLRMHPGPVREGTTVWVHGSGKWRPGVVARVTTRLDRTTVTVYHSAPSNPHRMYRKRLPVEALRVRA
jgi:hypothetical protein